MEVFTIIIFTSRCSSKITFAINFELTTRVPFVKVSEISLRETNLGLNLLLMCFKSINQARVVHLLSIRS